jgi:5-methylcytosine-specific restriction endonuclease McrA
MAPNPRRLSAYKRLAAEVCRPRDGARCHLCGELVIFGLRKRHPLGPSADHLIPLANGGELLDPNNLRLAHYGCNSDRGTQPIKRTLNRSSIWR